jgi:conjugative transfer region protein TrbK
MRRRIISQEELDRPKVVRIVVVLAAGALAAGAAAWLAGVEWDDTRERRRPVESRAVDALQAELLRCNGLGQAALDDPGCRSAWAENRRRFFSPGPRPSTPPAQDPRP